MINKITSYPRSILYLSTCFIMTLHCASAFAKPVLHQKKNKHFDHIIDHRDNSDEEVSDLNNPQGNPDSDPTQQLLLGGVNKYLDQYGIQLGLSWLSETAGIIHGGKRKGADYAHQVAFSVDMDWEKIIGWKGFSTHMMILNLAGRNASTDYIGDTQIQAQEIQGGGYGRFFHMNYVYGLQKLWDDRVEIRFGRDSVGNNFALSPFACQFMLIATCGQPRSIQSQQGFTPWPGTNWGAKILYRPTKNTYVQVGAYESSPWGKGKGGPAGFNWGVGAATGAFVPVEFGYDSNFGKKHLNGYLRIGAGLDTSRFDTWSAKATGSGKKDNRAQYWIMMGQMIHRNDAVKDHGLYVIANWGHDSPTTANFKDLYNIGILDRGFWHARPYDQFGLMMTYYTVPRGLSRAQQYQINNGMVSGGNGIYSGLLNGAPGIQSNSMLFEANYGISVYRGIMIMPVFEFFHNVAATRNTYKDAAVLGFRTNVVF
ncbi:Carbohydrate-selective porin OprB (OprB) (PDB:4GEY) [Commensalibacter papalotli (ex Botero et al. 2024)]|uniref:Carbohydrate-selective porin OprB (OprB) (PDB:4GEY) n=2 Tax=Commensalibacter papalotli (ex Botero et al. 2024) TaxID=2972766 RepID=A0ABM9HMD5_9PROT|nr:Carbohydrate-selective porin OprB (OprB) (PDB:4GEY) [Commensalibacter papalotli (ex Botero et al. 2024)]CAI3951967.1 Carbohydrate-selective porin OprB (OprB) (PDB:4GEY) [Commensalibacter papalotli (ex Botero et al. 2024)]